jgi:hypothetical protein
LKTFESSEFGNFFKTKKKDGLALNAEARFVFIKGFAAVAEKAATKVPHRSLKCIKKEKQHENT